MNVFSVLGQYSDQAIQLLEEQDIGLKTLRAWVETKDENLETLIKEGAKTGQTEDFVNALIQQQISKQQITRIRRSLPDTHDKITLIASLPSIIDATSAEYAITTYLPEMHTYLIRQFTDHPLKWDKRRQLHQNILPISSTHQGKAFKNIIQHITHAEPRETFFSYAQIMNLEEAQATQQLDDELNQQGVYADRFDGKAFYTQFKNKQAYLETTTFLVKLAQKRTDKRALVNIIPHAHMFIKHLGLTGFKRYAISASKKRKLTSANSVKTQADLAPYLDRRTLLDIIPNQHIPLEEDILREYKHGRIHLRNYLNIIEQFGYSHTHELFSKARKDHKFVELIATISAHPGKQTESIIFHEKDTLHHTRTYKLTTSELITYINVANKLTTINGESNEWYRTRTRELMSKKGWKKHQFAKAILTLNDKEVAQELLDEISLHYDQYTTTLINTITNTLNEIISEDAEFARKLITKHNIDNEFTLFAQEANEFRKLDKEKGAIYISMTAFAKNIIFGNDRRSIHEALTPYLLEGNLNAMEAGALYVASSHLARISDTDRAILFAQTVEHIAKYSQSLTHHLIINKGFIKNLPKEELSMTYHTLEQIARQNWRDAGAYIDLASKKTNKALITFQEDTQRIMQLGIPLTTFLTTQGANNEWYTKTQPNHDTKQIRAICYRG